DGINCIKYIPGNSTDLANKLLSISNDMARVKSIGDAAEWLARCYTAENRYTRIKSCLQKSTDVYKSIQTAQTST
ncbi:MAG: hypothetical protein V3R49_00490, partial [Gammaproteobacteria bacterium]